jgi:hypothetical protein
MAYLSQNRIDRNGSDLKNRARSSGDSAVFGSPGHDCRVSSRCERRPVCFYKGRSLVYGTGSLEDNSVNIPNIRNLSARRT